MYRRTHKVIYVVVAVALVILLLAIDTAIALAAPVAQQLPDVNLANYLTLLLLLGGIAYILEAVTELINQWIVKSLVPDAVQREAVLKAVTAALGIVFTISYGLDMFAVLVAAYADILGITPQYPQVAAWAGMIITGIALGRGSQWFHDAGQRRIGLDGA